MRNRFHTVLGAAALAVATLATAGCDDFLSVENPGVIEASTVDPVADAETFSRSAESDFFTAFDDVVAYGAWFSGEAWLDDTFPTRNDISKRVTDNRNGTLNTELYAPLSQAIASNSRVLQLLAGTPRETSVSAARAALNLGFSLTLMAETFCQGVISSGPEALGSPLTPAQTLDSAVVRFQQAVTLGTGLNTAEGTSIANAARVGLARAYLQKGEYQNAINAGTPVPAAFVYNAIRVDDPSNRGRLGNTVYSFTITRPNLVVPPYYRDLNDARVPSTRTGQPGTGQGGQLVFHAQNKYPAWNTPIRVASGLEARYLVAEAQLKLGNTAPAVALSAERRAAGSAVPGDNFATGNAVLIELLDQKSRDLFLEGHHLGDWRRNPNETPYTPRAGTVYYIPAVGGNFGALTCLPISASETDNNPNFPRA